jgi:hypothetical protein
VDARVAHHADDLCFIRTIDHPANRILVTPEAAGQRL